MILFDSLGNEIKFSDSSITGALNVLNAEVVLNLNGGEATAFLDLRGTFNLTVEVQGTIDGTNYFVIPVQNQTTEVWQIATSTVGQYKIQCAGLRSIRARVTGYTSGIATASLRASRGVEFVKNLPQPSTLNVTVTATVGSAATLTIPAVTGMFHYMTRVIVQRFAAAALTAAATPVLVTTTNQGPRTLSFPADAAPQGSMYSEEISPSQPIKSAAAGIATTFVMPATPNVIWRATVDYYVGL